MKKILIIYYSNNGSTKKMAEKISRGVNSVENIEAIIRTLPNIKNTFDSEIANEENVLFATNEDLLNCDGLIMGSPTHFGNMAAPMKVFLDTTTQNGLTTHYQESLREYLLQHLVFMVGKKQPY